MELTQELSTHAPSNVEVTDGNAILSLTADAAGGTSGTGGTPGTAGTGAGNPGVAGATSCPANGEDGCSFTAPRSNSGRPWLVLFGAALGAALARRRA